eukprot:TRINITY_DN10049_c0_g1_i1.p1 TRINITY_DN10049_c0_g1~~TRINITY_DN10049_c0_g1_i1.p1  ORF type:complete len:626 (-),score=92.14 TRINITY_DN10049_c0_g1_i1:95-1972(-)
MKLYNFRDLSFALLPLDADGVKLLKDPQGHTVGRIMDPTLERAVQRDGSGNAQGHQHAIVLPGRIFRSSEVTRGATTGVEVKEIVKFLRDDVGVKTIVDMRDRLKVDHDPYDYIVQSVFSDIKVKDHKPSHNTFIPMFVEDVKEVTKTRKRMISRSKHDAKKRRKILKMLKQGKGDPLGAPESVFSALIPLPRHLDTSDVDLINKAEHQRQGEEEKSKEADDASEGESDDDDGDDKQDHKKLLDVIKFSKDGDIKSLNQMPERKRINVALINSYLKFKGLYWDSAPMPTKLDVLVAAVIPGRSCTEQFAKETMNPLGMEGLNKLMLTYSKREILAVLRICADPHNYPLMLHCESGKDRTGLISALILKICGVANELIVEDYAQSERFLKPVMRSIRKENKEKGLQGFDGTPRHVMQETLRWLDEGGSSKAGPDEKHEFEFDSGFRDFDGYLDLLGFSVYERAQLKACMTCPDIHQAAQMHRALVSAREKAKWKLALSHVRDNEDQADNWRQMSYLLKLEGHVRDKWKIRFCALSDKTLSWSRSPGKRERGSVDVSEIAWVKGPVDMRAYEDGSEHGLEVVLADPPKNTVLRFCADLKPLVDDWLQAFATFALLEAPRLPHHHQSP